MSEQQIKQILDKIDSNDRSYKKRLDDQDLMLEKINGKLNELEPVKTAFNSVMGFDKVAMWVLKFLAAIGVAIGVIYGFINWLRQ